jgi:hypothetical protein
MTPFLLFADFLPLSAVAIPLALMARQVRIFLRPGCGRHRRVARARHAVRGVAE